MVFKLWVLLIVSIQACLIKSKESKIPESGFYGHISVNQDNDDLYYMLYPPRNPVQNTPLIIWLSGGPGCASTMSMLYENGPIQIDKNSNAQKNSFSWNDKAWLLYVDQPLNTGFSHSSNRNIPELEWQISETFLAFMIGLYKKHPELTSLRLFVAGNSYAGHYVPAIAHTLHQYSSNKFNLIGIALGNAWTSPAVQQVAYIDFADKYDLVDGDKDLLARLRPKFEICQKLAGLDSPLTKSVGMSYCNKLFDSLVVDPKTGAPRWNPMNYKEPFDNSRETAWISSPDVLAELKSDKLFESCSPIVEARVNRLDLRTDTGPFVGALLDAGINVLAYNGDLDLVCSYISGEAWTNNVKWAQQSEFQKSMYQKVTLPNGTAYGETRGVGKFQFIRVYQAGHLASHDKPEESLYMINKFTGLI